jgi:hypothetical protein
MKKAPIHYTDALKEGRGTSERGKSIGRRNVSCQEKDL